MASTFISLFRNRTPLIRPGILSAGVVYGSNAIGIAYFLKHSLLLSNYKTLIERIGVYGPDEPAEELNEMLKNIITNDLKDKASENTPISLYLTSGMETSHIGTVGTVTGGFVGVPVFYEFKNEEDVRENILIKYVDSATGSDEEKSDCFLLSNDAKKYGIAREILLINTLHVYINGLLPFAVSMAVNVLYNEMSKMYHIMKTPLYSRCLIYVATAIVGLNLWRYLYKQLLHYYESEVESSVAQLGMDYIKGGIEYCTKDLERSLLPIETKNTKYGVFKSVEDSVCKLLPKGIPIRTRLEYLNKIADQYTNSKLLQQ